MKNPIVIKKAAAVIVLDAKHFGSWPTLVKMPELDLPEIALIGRSNVGKSTLVNSLVGRKSLARVSSTPGKTREAVLFQVRLGAAEVEVGSKRQEKSVILVDLPGFGYAKVGKDQKQDFQKLIVDYIKKRKALKAICLLNDCRRAPSEDEEIIWQVAKDRGCFRTLVVTKTDKLARGQIKPMLAELQSYYPGADCVISSGSSVDKKALQNQLFCIFN